MAGTGAAAADAASVGGAASTVAAPDLLTSADQISDDEIVERMGGRRVCASCGAPYHVKNLPPKVEGVCDACGGKLEARADDKPEVVRDRLKVYHKETAPLKDFYAERNLLKTVDNQPTVAETTAAILKALGL